VHATSASGATADPANDSMVVMTRLAELGPCCVLLSALDLVAEPTMLGAHLLEVRGDDRRCPSTRACPWP
jgi:hypothetical protein